MTGDLITLRSQVQSCPRHQRITPAQRPFREIGKGLWRCRLACSYNICTTDLTFGFDPDGQSTERWIRRRACFAGGRLSGHHACRAAGDVVPALGAGAPGMKGNETHRLHARFGTALERRDYRVASVGQRACDIAGSAAGWLRTQRGFIGRLLGPAQVAAVPRGVVEVGL